MKLVKRTFSVLVNRTDNPDQPKWESWSAGHKNMEAAEESAWHALNNHGGDFKFAHVAEVRRYAPDASVPQPKRASRRKDSL